MVQQVKRGRGRPRKVQTEDNMVSNDSFDAGPVIEPVQESSVAPEASSNELPMGTDGSLLFAGREEKVLEIGEDATRSQIRRAFSKFSKGRLENKKLLSQFVDMVAA